MLRLVLALLALAAPAKPGGELARATLALRQARGAADARGFSDARWIAPELLRAGLGDPATAQVALHLPAREPECVSRKVKCWLVLYLPGFDSPASSIRSFAAELAALDRRAGAAPIVVVALDGRTRLGGGWYVDSPASGRWASLILRVLLPAARAALAPGTPASRTLVVGHSMGGFGAMRLAAAHPHVLGGFAAFEPAADLSRLGAQLVRVLESRRALPDLDALLHGGAGHFDARLLVTLDAALDPDPKSPHDTSALVDASSTPWRLAPKLRAALARFDLTRAPPPAVGGVIFVGRNDRLVPPDALEPLRSKRVQLVITGGDHVNHRAPDLERALELLAR